jgi:hypothetical protein
VNVQLKLLKLYITATMRYLATLLVTLLLAVPAISVELFRYRYRAEDGGEFEYICEADEQNVPKTVSEEKAAEIAADWVTVFYHVQAGVIERGISHKSNFTLAFLFLGHASGLDATNAFRRTASQRDGCSAENRGTALIVAQGFRGAGDNPAIGLGDDGRESGQSPPNFVQRDSCCFVCGISLPRYDGKIGRSGPVDA